MLPFAVRGFDHIVLRSIDPARLIAFYRDALGCRVVHTQPKLGLTHLQAGAQLIDIVDANGPLREAGDAPPSPSQRNLDHFCLGVAPFDAAAIAAHLARFGAAAERPRPRYGATGEGLSLYFHDPDGNRVELKAAGA